MNRQSFLHKSQVIGLSVVALLAVVFVLAVQLPDQSSQANIQGEAGAAPADLLAAIDPADRKFFTGQALHASQGESALVADVDPADRKFFLGGYTWSMMSRVQNVPLAGVDPADRKFYYNWYPAVGR